MGYGKSASSGIAPEVQYQTSVAAKSLIFQGFGNLYGIYAENNSGSDVFLQVFDAAATGDVTLGTTAPVLEFRIPASGAFGGAPTDGASLKYMGKGCIIAVTTLRSGSVLAAASVTTWTFSNKPL